jgi:hypothetical protein
MKHPNEGTLALHAGGDLGTVARWQTERHLAKCDRCRDSVAAFAELREVLPELAEIPEVPWNRLAAEMRANIRLGLAAGECVRIEAAPVPEYHGFAGGRVALAFASVLAVVFTGLLLERPLPVASQFAARDGAAGAAKEGPLVQATENGIQVRAGGSAFRLMNAGAKSVTYSAGADGSMGARYVDPETGYVTINNVYVE